MANTIDELNFEVIISDKQFDQQIKAIEKKARDFNTSLSNILNIRKISTQMSQKDVENARRVWQAKVDEQRAQERINREKIRTEGLQRKINAQIDGATKRYQAQGRILNELKGYVLGYLSIHGASQLLTSLVKVTGEFEEQKTVLAAMLGDLNVAEGIITRIQGLAVESPFQFKELTTYAKQLSAFSVPAQELYDTTKMLADISAGLGVDMNRIILAYGQVRSAAFLRGQEVRQFTEAGIPILDELAKQFTELEGRAVSTGEVFDKISQRLVPFEMVAKIFKDMTAEGGKFYEMQEIRAATLTGKLSNLKDAYEVMLNEIGQSQSDNMKDGVDMLRRMMENYENTGRLLVEIVATYGVYRAALLATDVAAKVFLGTNQGLFKSLEAIKTALLANPYTAIAATLAAVGLVVYKTATSLESYEKVQKSVIDSEQKFTRNLTKETTKLDALYAKLKLAEEGTEEYAEAKKQIYSQYASYISELQNEGVAVDNLTTIYGKLKEKIEQSAEARFRMTAARNLENTYDAEMDKMFDKYERLTKNIERFLDRTLSATEKEGLWQYLLGNDDILKNTPELHGLSNAIQDYIKKGTGVSVVWLREQIGKIMSEYEEGKKKIDALFGTEPPAPTTISPIVNLGGEDDEESPQEKVQAEIDAVNRLRDAYDTLAPYMNGEMLRKTLTALFPNADQELIKSLDFRAKLVELAAELNKFDKTASQKLLDSLSGERASEIASAFKAVETYKNMLDSWLGEDFNLTGEGVTFDISKIIRDLNNQYGKINQKAIEASDLLTKAQMGDEAALKTVREVYGEEVWQKYLINGERTIEELANLERESSRKTANEKIRDLSSKYVSEQMSKNNISLSDFGDKTAEQIQGLIDRMKDIQSEAKKEANAAFVDVVLGNLSEGQYARWKMLLDVIEELQGKIDDTEEEFNKKIIQSTVDGMNAISDLGGEIAKLGGSLNNSVITKLGENLERVASATANVINAAQAKDTIAIIANVAALVIESIADIATAAYEEQMALNDAAREYRDIMLEIRRDAHTGMFGTDEMSLAAENAKILVEAQEEYQNALNALENDKKIRNNKYIGGFSFNKQSVADVLGIIADDQGWDLYRENGEINIDKMIAYYDAYSKYLTKEQKAMVDAVIEGYEAQNDAAAQSAEYLTSLFSGVADNIASSMVDAFIKSGDAAIDMSDIISDVAKDMVADLIKSVYLLPILNDYQADFAKIEADKSLSTSRATEKKLALLESALAEISGQSGNITEVLERFEEYLQGSDSGADPLASGIKGMTEDTANLISSYINAIRSDLSYAKVLWNAMSQDTRNIANALIGFSAPSLMEYQAQIAANTFNTAMNTQEILSRLDSVITYTDGPTGIRVYS